MKKLLITSLLVLFGFVGAFASADSVVYTNGTPSPSSIYYVGNLDCEGMGGNYICKINVDTINGEFAYKISSVKINGNTQVAYGLGDSCTSDSCSLSSFDVCAFDCPSDLVNGNYDYLTLDFIPYESYTYNFSLSSDNFYTSLPSNGGDNSGSLLPGGESDLSGIITGLNSTITEFIPYLVYLGLGIITVIIGFVAVRWLINRTQAKIRGTFSSGRRRR